MNQAREKRHPKRLGCVFVISAPSGTGKSTLIKRLRAAVPGLQFSISCTTRPPRKDEENGREYFFIPEPEFKKRLKRGEFIEWARVHGQFYGTTRKQLQEAIKGGHDVLLDIDTQGHRKIKRQLPEAVSIFLMPPSFQELEARLRRRSEDGPESIARRLKDSRREMAGWKEYDYLVVNDRVSRAARSLELIVRAARLRRLCQQPRVREICKTFGEK